MAAVVRGAKLNPVSPPGYEVNRKGQAASAIERGDLLVRTAAAPTQGFEVVWDVAPGGTVDAQGIALMDAVAGQTVSVGIQGEMDGFVDLDPGAPLYPSATVDGGLDDAAPVGATIRIVADTTTRIAYSFV